MLVESTNNFLANVNIGSTQVGDKCNVFVIAEIGINHDGDLKKALKLIGEAKKSGAHAAKIQTYSTENRVKKDSPIFGILKQCELSYAHQKELFAYAKQENILLFSTPFDTDAVDFLESINVPCYKVASFDIVNKSLLKKIASTGKTMIMSRGMANKDEIETAMNIAKGHGCPIALLHCVSAYPVKNNSDLNLSTIGALKSVYHCPVGYSDHTLGINASVFAVAAGASIIEKHFTLSQSDQGPDHAISMEPRDLKKMIEEITNVQVFLGSPTWGPVPSENDILQYRRKT